MSQDSCVTIPYFKLPIFVERLNKIREVIIKENCELKRDNIEGNPYRIKYKIRFGLGDTFCKFYIFSDEIIMAYRDDKDYEDVHKIANIICVSLNNFPVRLKRVWGFNWYSEDREYDQARIDFQRKVE